MVINIVSEQTDNELRTKIKAMRQILDEMQKLLDKQAANITVSKTFKDVLAEKAAQTTPPASTPIPNTETKVPDNTQITPETNLITLGEAKDKNKTA